MRVLLTIFLLSFLFLRIPAVAQQTTADSLERRLSASSGKERIETIIALTDIYESINSRKAIKYCKMGLELARKLKDKKAEGNFLGGLGFNYINLNNKLALRYSLESLSLREKIGDREGISNCNNTIGVIFYFTGNYRESINYHLRSLKTREDLHLEYMTAVSYNNLSLVHTALQNYKGALNYLQKALRIFKKFGDLTGVAVAQDNIGNLKVKTGELNEALKYFLESRRLNRALGNKKMEAYSIGNIGNIYRTWGKYKESLEFYTEALSIYQNINDENGIAGTESSIAQIYMSEGRPREAPRHAEIALKYARKIPSLECIASSSEILSLCYKKAGNFRTAYKYLLINQAAEDSLKNADIKKALDKITLKNDFERIKRDKDAELRSQKTLTNCMLACTVLLLLIALYAYREFRRKIRSKMEFEIINKKLQEVNSTKDRFFSIISHDLRNPFQGILTSSDLLSKNQDKLSPEEKAWLADVIHNSSTAAHNLLENLLVWSRNQTKQIRLEPKELCLKDFIEDSLRLIEGNASNKRINLLKQIPGNCLAWADSDTISTVLRNLLSNAVKFTPEKGEIFVRAETTGDFVAISISDTGTGIPKSQIEKLFKIDSAFSTPGTNNEKGSGIGLILCKDFVNANGGELYVESQPDQGSTFRFTLPRKPAEEACR